MTTINYFETLESYSNYYYDYLGCFSVPAKNKTPYVSWTNINDIEACIKNFKDNPTADQIAIIPANGFVTLDFDKPECFEEFVDKVGDLSKCWIVKAVKGTISTLGVRP